MEYNSFRHCSIEIQRNGHFTEESPRVDAAGGASPTGEDRDFEAKLPDEDRFGSELVKIGLAEVERGSNRMHVRIEEVTLGRNETAD